MNAKTRNRLQSLNNSLNNIIKLLAVETDPVVIQMMLKDIEELGSEIAATARLAQ